MSDRTKRLFWYIVIWRNDAFARTRYKPMKVGSIVGIQNKPEGLRRIGLNDKKRDFETVERYKFLMRGTGKQLKTYLETGVRG